MGASQANSADGPRLRIRAARRSGSGMVPGWIGELTLRPMSWAIVAALAELGEPDAAGNIIAVGGDELLDQCGCSRSTFWRHLRRLETVGAVVCVGRGGHSDGRRFANVYGLPAEPGALEPQRRRRRVQRMVADGRGGWRAEVIEPGEQPTLWSETPADLPACQNEARPACQNEARQRVRMRRAHGFAACQNEAHPSGTGTGTGSKNQMGVSHKRGSGGHGAAGRGGPTLTDVRAEDLRDLGRVAALYRQALRAGWCAASEAGWLDFVAAACNARRCGRTNQGGLFIRLIRQRRFAGLPNIDEDTALAWIRRAGGGDLTPEADDEEREVWEEDE